MSAAVAMSIMLVVIAMVGIYGIIDANRLAKSATLWSRQPGRSPLMLRIDEKKLPAVVRFIGVFTVLIATRYLYLIWVR
jgi:hypothetical protein